MNKDKCQFEGGGSVLNKKNKNRLPPIYRSTAKKLYPVQGDSSSIGID